jgi:predicted CopG family antitoxin
MDQYLEKNKETVVTTGRLLGVNKQVYNKAKQLKFYKQNIVKQVIDLIRKLRSNIRCLETKKLYYSLEDFLKKIKVGRISSLGYSRRIIY